jgi:hypothetical protein
MSPQIKTITTSLLFLLLICKQGNCQSYSITNVLQITPPYSSYIPDYLDDFNTQFSIILTLNDLYEPQHNVRLKIKFEGDNYSIETSDYASVPPITLNPGAPTIISGSQLTPYLSTQNMVFSGIDPNYYEQHKSLPEGPCTICVEVIDYENPNQIILGNLSCTSLWFSKFDPPILNMPFCGEPITHSESQFVSFNWTPLHVDLDLSNPTIYKFELFEIRPEGMDPNTIAISTLPYFTTETSNPFLLYTLTEPPLYEGKHYAWRIQALDPNGRDKFNNLGYSEVCSFQFGSPQQNILDQTVISLNTEGVSSRRGTAWWNMDFNLEGYEVHYRKSAGGNWFKQEITDNVTTLKNLEPSTDYDVKVRGFIENNYSDWSNISQFTTASSLDYACNSTIFPPIPTDFQPAKNLHRGDIVQIGQFEMEIKEADELSQEGRYKGIGLINVPFILLNLHVSFEDILVDDELIVREGTVLTITKGLEQWMEDIELDEAPTTDIDGVIEDIVVEDSTIIIYLDDDTLHFNFDQEPMVFQDEEGMQYAVYKDGRIESSSYLETSFDQLEASANFQVTFKAANNQEFGFDRYNNHNETDYEIIRLEDNSLYHVPYKSIGIQQSDYVLANLICNDCNSDSLSFSTSTGLTLDHTSIGYQEYKIHLQDFDDHQTIYALYNSKEIGKLKVKVYAEKEKELTIVNLTNSNLNESSISNYINQTFKQANITWNIEYLNTNIEDQIFGSDLLVEIPDVTLMKKYSDEMRAIRDQFFNDNPSASKNRYYLFVILGFSDPNTKGYMVRGRSIGFISADSPDFTYAHELGHGLGGLKHTFPDIPEGSSDNLMDYGDDNHLSYQQWKSLRNPVVINWFDEEEDGSYTEEDIISYFNNEKIWRLANETTAYPLIDGTLLKIEGVTEVMFEKYGRVSRFKIGTETYKAFYLKYNYVQSGDWFWVNAGYFKENDYALLDSSGQDATWSNWESNFSQDHRFSNFIQTNIGDSISSYGLKKINGQYFQCYCQHWSTIQEPTTISDYTNKQEANNWRITEVIYPNDLSYEDCKGTECVDLSSFQFEEGKGTDLFYLLASSCPQEKLYDFKDLADHINEITNGISIGFYTEEEQDDPFYDFYIDQIFDGKLTDFFKVYEIYDLQSFHLYFPFISVGDKSIPKVFSSYNFWGFLNEYPNYNINSFDYTSFDYDLIHNYNFSDEAHILEIADYLETLLDHQISSEPGIISSNLEGKIRTYIDRLRTETSLVFSNKLHNRSNILAILKALGVFKPYDYKLDDLRMRRQIQNGGGPLFTAITNHESSGEAIPLHAINEYDQYVAKYGTESAFYLGFQYFKMYVEILWQGEVIMNVLSKIQKLYRGYSAAKSSGGIRRFERVVSKSNTAPKFSQSQIDEYVEFATKQNGENKVMLGRWEPNSINSYEIRAGNDHTFFAMEHQWDDAFNKVNGNPDELWRINKKFIDQQKSLNKEFYFSHDPFSAPNESYFSREVNYLIDLGVENFQMIEPNLWKAIW